MPTLTLTASHSGQMPWVVARVHHQLAALHSSAVRELVIMPEVTPVPRMPDYFRGVMNWRGKIIPCIDLRKRLGMPGAKEELDELAGLITARAADHLAWLEELYKSVEERRRFTLTTDPHACAFGQWYDNFRTNNLTVSALLRKMDAPHKAIHALAIRVEDLKEQGKFEDAARAIHSARETTLARLLDLFSSFETVLQESYRPVAVIVHAAGTLAAITVDSVEAVEHIASATIEELSEKGVESYSSVIRRVGQRPKDGGLVGLIDEAQILEWASAALPQAA
ncbi:MAG: chemotaxis protein CheW [Bryobacteraceae bacterium]|nr:chemotaxis protein CheW [Bryobacteraceae bacterium]